MIIDPSGEIEVGAAGAELRLCQAREALRHAELRLASQANTLQAFETRATSLLGWIVLIVSTLAGGAIVALDAGRVWRALALGAGFLPAFFSAGFALRLLWPKNWHVTGYEPGLVRAECENELDMIEWLCDGYAKGIVDNEAFLDTAGDRVRWAWWGLLATPIVAGAAIALFRIM